METYGTVNYGLAFFASVLTVEDARKYKDSFPSFLKEDEEKFKRDEITEYLAFWLADGEVEEWSDFSHKEEADCLEEIEVKTVWLRR